MSAFRMALRRRVSAITQYVLDTFTDSNGTALSSHAPDVDVVSGGWTIDGTTAATGNDHGHTAWDVQSNKVRQTGVAEGEYLHMASIDSGQANCIISAALTTASSLASSVRLMFARQDRNNWWVADANTNTNTFRLRTFSSAASFQMTDRASVAVTIDPGNTYEIKVTRNPSGGNTSATLDGANNISSTLSFNDSSTVHGLCEYRKTSSYPNNNSYDTFVVEPI